MDLEQFRQNAHLYFGITKKEFARRLSLGLIDLELLKLQVEQNSLDRELECRCEIHLQKNSIEQVDKNELLDDSTL